MDEMQNMSGNTVDRDLRVAVDIGGTFTDLAAFNPRTGQRWFAKASTTPDDPARGITDCLDKLKISPARFEIFVHGTTLVINACLEMKGAKTALITTDGFRDVLEIGRGNRTESFNYRFRRHKPFVPREMRFEVEERMRSDGTVHVALNEKSLIKALEAAKRQGAEAVAICFLHAYRNPAHEQQAARVASAYADWYVSASHELSREFREYERTSTVVMNAFVGPKVSRYLDNLATALATRGFGGKFYLMESNGGVADVQTVKQQPILLMESGPVGGIAGAIKQGGASGRRNLLTFDMGGTTAKAALVEDGVVTFDTLYYVNGFEHGYPVQTSVVDVVEVGAGGGSIAWIDELGALRIGPKSAGSNPGPAAYGLGNESPTVTDANIVLGRLDSDKFLNGEMTIHPKLSERALVKLGGALGYDAVQMASGVIRLANLTMSGALRRVSIERGKDPRDFTMVACGGNGPLHAAELAEELGVRRLLIPRMPAHYSAFGMLLADARYDASHTWVCDIPPAGEIEGLREVLAGLRSELAHKVALSIGSSNTPRFEDYAEMRHRGQDQTVKVRLHDALDAAALKAAFADTYGQRYGHVSDIPIQIVSLRVNCQTPLGEALDLTLQTEPPAAPSTGVEKKRVFSIKSNAFEDYAVYARHQLREGQVVQGPCLIDDHATTTHVPQGWSASPLADGMIELRFEA